VSGSIENRTGKDLAADAKMTLRGYEHGGDPSTGPTEVVTLEGTVNADGTYLFANVEIPENRIYLAELKVNGETYQSGFAVVKPGMTELTLPSIIMYVTTDDFSALKIVSMQMYFDFAQQGDAQVFTVYSIMNNTDKTVTVKMVKGKEVPFLVFPKGATQLGFEATQDSAPFVSTDGGFSMPPNEKPYGLVAFASVPKTDEIDISQSVLLPVDEVAVYLPEGMDATGKSLTDAGIQPVQAMNFHVYKSGKQAKDAVIEFTITGSPSTSTAVNPDVTQNKNLLIGVGAFGLVLILLGGWLFIRDRNKVDDGESGDEDDDDADEFDDPESAMDAIIALDDLHRAGKISDEAYQKRREELKNALKRKS
jgi:hypothetical protein